MNVKNKTFAASCCQGNSVGTQSAFVPNPSSVSSASKTYSPSTLLGQAGWPVLACSGCSATTGAGAGGAALLLLTGAAVVLGAGAAVLPGAGAETTTDPAWLPMASLNVCMAAV